MKLIGIQRVDYTNKNGYHILGFRLHTSVPAKAEDAIGEITDVVFVSDKIYGAIDNLSVGDEIAIAYSKYGKVTAVSVVG